MVAEAAPQPGHDKSPNPSPRALQLASEATEIAEETLADMTFNKRCTPSRNF
jgi:hypothetical protein